ncbi:hypothetical protein AVEN_167952-1 [Araneus ventricosus]|uniref:CRAL-TRIO domain-containing protein n=1 Tax=Araneus ventricosus TaxID=182803 RepID=A0A4Y2WFC4_ARAVE|nr:hypothetical protein AVEN_167952-1 [Araneus ventricosus]
MCILMLLPRLLGFNNVATKMEIQKYLIYFVEQNKENIIKQGGNGKRRFQLGKPILAPIYDFEELTYSEAVNVKTLQLLILIVQTFMDNYPELLRTIRVINGNTNTVDVLKIWAESHFCLVNGRRYKYKLTLVMWLKYSFRLTSDH